jgi:hypothetical protein
MLNETLKYLGIAFASSAALIVMSKIILQFLIRRPADYYLAAELRQEEMILNSAGLSIQDEIETDPEGENTSEHIHAEPQISLDEAVELHLFDKDHIPDHLLHLDAEMPDKTDDKTAEPVEPVVEPAVDGKPEMQTTPDIPDLPVITDETIAQETAAEAETGYASDNAPDIVSKTNADRKSGSGKRSGAGKRKPKNPSMKMRKDELIAMAVSMGIEVPENAVKKDIIDMIYAKRDGDSSKSGKASKNGNNKNGNNKSSKAGGKTGNNRKNGKDTDNKDIKKRDNKSNRRRRTSSGRSDSGKSKKTETDKDIS